MRYSGSPIPLSCSEIEDKKYVLELTVEEQKIGKVASIEVPLFRELRCFSGNLEEVEAALNAYEVVTPLPPYVCLLYTSRCV